MMEQRKRLIELLEQHCLLRHDVLECSAGKEIAECSDCLANWLIENSVIVPPCKGGDTVYYISSKYERQGRKKVRVEFVDTGVVDRIIIGEKGVPQIDVCNDDNVWTTFDAEDDFGKTVFLPREEAEAELERRKN